MTSYLNSLFFILGLLWLIREIRACFFWLYLWQLKDYHLGRFVDHFRTEKGKKLVFGFLPIAKIVLLLYALYVSSLTLPVISLTHTWQLYALWMFVLIALYVLELSWLIRGAFKKTLKVPVFTSKTISLTVLVIFTLFTFLLLLFRNFYDFQFYWFAFYLLLFDVLTPFLTTFIVFMIHFLTVIIFRNQIIKKATKKREEFKNLIVVGITGSYGKTSTKEILAGILSEKFKVLKDSAKIQIF